MLACGGREESDKRVWNRRPYLTRQRGALTAENVKVSVELCSSEYSQDMVLLLESQNTPVLVLLFLVTNEAHF
jgi:hypothetical protein